MARLSIEERIAQLEARKKTLQARLTKQERANDTRRKVLLGAFLLERLGDAKASARDPQFSDDLKRWVGSELPSFLTRPNDRALFPEWISDESSSTPGRAGEPTGSGNANGSIQKGLKGEGDEAQRALSDGATTASGSSDSRDDAERPDGSRHHEQHASPPSSEGFTGS